MENQKEEKITIKPRAQRKYRPTKIIVNDRTESRKRFLEINSTDLRLRLSNILQSQAKERRQKIIKEYKTEKKMKQSISFSKLKSKRLKTIISNSKSSGRNYQNVQSNLTGWDWKYQVGSEH